MPAGGGYLRWPIQRSTEWRSSHQLGGESRQAGLLPPDAVSRTVVAIRSPKLPAHVLLRALSQDTCHRVRRGPRRGALENRLFGSAGMSK
jgi:hypothetical protein